jgi:hypothetical protein
MGMLGYIGGTEVWIKWFNIMIVAALLVIGQHTEFIEQQFISQQWCW